MTGVGETDVILVGGGLANTLIALALTARHPALRLTLVEQGATLGGRHTWSFHGTDVTADQMRTLAPLVAHSWDRQDVRFPGHDRTLWTSYHSIPSARLHCHALQRLGAAVLLGRTAAVVEPDHVVLADGARLAAPLVIDGRGFGGGADTGLALGFQKFVGLEVETAVPHGRSHPLLMDATVAQLDGYRFVYTLPLSPTRVLIEDTYYSDTADLDADRIEQRVRAYAAAQGWVIGRVVERETGVLPIALAGDLEEHWRPEKARLPRAGLRAWLFHATTGYSLPLAVTLAEAIAAAPRLTSSAIARLIETTARRHWHQQRLFRLLNRFLFIAADPPERVRVLERFYRLPQETIERFYAGRLTASDVASLMALMAARPPVALSRAWSALPEAAAWRFTRNQTSHNRAGKP